MRLLDILISFLLIVFTLPVMIAAALLIAFVDGLPVLYRSSRAGRFRKTFSHFKFRTMRPGPETGRVFFEQERITGLGKILRASHIDELPELFLVLAGRMSLVGPRPLPEKLLPPGPTPGRDSVLPGLTCLAQISLLRSGQLDKRLQFKLDEIYAGRRSPGYNFRISCATFKVMLRAKKADLDPELTEDRRKFGKHS